MLLFCGLTLLLLINGASPLDRKQGIEEKNEATVLRLYEQVVQYLEEKESIPRNETYTTVLNEILRSDITPDSLCMKATQPGISVFSSMKYLVDENDILATPIAGWESNYQWGNKTALHVSPSRVTVRTCRNMTGCCNTGERYKKYTETRRVPVQVVTTQEWNRPGFIKYTEDVFCECRPPKEAFMCGCPEPFVPTRNGGKCACTCHGLNPNSTDHTRCLKIESGKRLKKVINVYMTDNSVRSMTYHEYKALVHRTKAIMEAGTPEAYDRHYAFPSCSDDDVVFNETKRKCPKDISASDESSEDNQELRPPTTTTQGPIRLNNRPSNPDTSSEFTGSWEEEEEEIYKQQRKRKKNKKSKAERQRAKVARIAAEVEVNAQENWVKQKQSEKSEDVRKLERKLNKLAEEALEPLNHSNTTSVVGLKVLTMAQQVAGNSTVITARAESQYGFIWCSMEEEAYPFTIATQYGNVHCKVKGHPET